MNREFLELLSPIEHCESAEMDIKKHDDIWLFTWNPNDRIISPNDPDLKWHTMVGQYLRHLRRCCKKFAIQPEFSDMGRLHCHGWIVITDKIKWIKSVLPKLQRAGKLKINKARSTAALYYYLKDVNITMGLLRDPFPYTPYTAEYYTNHLITKYCTPKDKPKHMDLSNFFDWPDIII